MSPVDVVLDRDAALVVQPDIIFVATDRLRIVRDRVWGAPDLVVEVLSPRTARRDRTTKLRWYRRYGVKECWLVDPKARCIEVIDLQEPAGGRETVRLKADPTPTFYTTFSGRMRVRSPLLREFGIPAGKFFE